VNPKPESAGKLSRLEEVIAVNPLEGEYGIGHTRWATHGRPSERNAHPHFSGDSVALVHNGIIENYQELREELRGKGYVFNSDTDTEAVAHLIAENIKRNGDLFAAVREAVKRLQGAYALVAIAKDDPETVVAARVGCPVVVGLGIGENYVASDIQALLPVTRRFQFLEEGDVALITRQKVEIVDGDGNAVDRKEHQSDMSADAVERGDYRHYMLKEIFEQPRAIAETLEERLSSQNVLEQTFGIRAAALFEKVRNVHIVACGTSFHAGIVARYFIEQYAKLPCTVEVASEFRYRNPVIPADTLFVCISQSGETADTLAALRLARQADYLATLAICNVPESSLVRESDLVLMTRAGPEIGVASTKAFTTQLVALNLLTVVLARHNGLSAEREAAIVQGLKGIARNVEAALELDERIAKLAEAFVDKQHALFLGRGVHYAIALEGALKLKEISYIHAEAYAAGELKHGPLALVDEHMPIIALVPDDKLSEKVRSNLEEVRARGGRLIIFAAEDIGFEADERSHVITLPNGVSKLTRPALYTIPLQLLSYHVAVLRGTDVDKPRNLAKSVTVE
jgi:glucosamine--fructose-6-phosphate aminotransferase (isomerizing)